MPSPIAKILWLAGLACLALSPVQAQETCAALFLSYDLPGRKPMPTPIKRLVVRGMPQKLRASVSPSLHNLSVSVEGFDDPTLKRASFQLGMRDATKALKPGTWKPLEPDSEILVEARLDPLRKTIAEFVLAEFDVNTEGLPPNELPAVTHLNAKVQFTDGSILVVQIAPTRPLQVQNPPVTAQTTTPPLDPNMSTWYAKPVETSLYADVIAWPLVTPTLYYRINKGRTTRYTKPLVFQKTGIYQLVYWAETPYGMKSEEKSHTIYYDDRPPQVDFRLNIPRMTENETVLRVEGRVNPSLSGMRYQFLTTILNGPGTIRLSYVIPVKADNTFSEDFKLGVAKGKERQTFLYKVSLNYQNKALAACNASREIKVSWKGK